MGWSYKLMNLVFGDVTVILRYSSDSDMVPFSVFERPDQPSGDMIFSSVIISPIPGRLFCVGNIVGARYGGDVGVGGNHIIVAVGITVAVNTGDGIIVDVI
jgi:hypothetical protein